MVALAVVIVLLVVGSLIFHFASPWYFTPLASNWSTIDFTVDVTFWVCGLLLAYTYVGYPLLIALKARLRPRPVARRGHTPFVSIVTVARDEASRIDARIHNLLALDYPAEKLDIKFVVEATPSSTRWFRRRAARSWCSPTRGSGSTGTPWVR